VKQSLNSKDIVLSAKVPPSSTHFFQTLTCPDWYSDSYRHSLRRWIMYSYTYERLTLQWV